MNEPDLMGKARQRSMTLIAAAGGVFVFLVFLKIAWVTDDAYIIFRSLEQLFDGNGPRWNPHNRVQVYTSPLWYWSLAVFRIFSDNVFLNAVIASGVFFVATMLLIAKLLSDSLKWLATMGLLVSSIGFFDYTTAGLENALCYFLITIYLSLYYQLFATVAAETPAQKATVDGDDRKQRKRLVRGLLLCFGFVLTCRHDMVTLMLLPTVYAAWSSRHWFSAGELTSAVLIGLSPIIVWSTFSLVYYGALVPNTAYAKINTGISRSETWRSGFHYLITCTQVDAITSAVVVGSPLMLITTRTRHVVALVGGIAINLAYILSVGGDFMVGRFLSFGYLVTVLVLMLYVIDTGTASGRQWAAIILAGAVVYMVFYHHTPVNSPLVYSNKAKAPPSAIDERGHYEEASLVKYCEHRDAPYFPVYPEAKAGYEFSKGKKRYVEMGRLGYFSYWAGLDRIIVDPYALTDPLLARLPVDRNARQRIGHFRRKLPDGYRRSILQNDDLITNQDLNEFNKKVKIITQSEDLFSWERIKTIVAMNLGLYNDMIPAEY